MFYCNFIFWCKDYLQTNDITYICSWFHTVNISVDFFWRHKGISIIAIQTGVLPACCLSLGIKPSFWCGELTVGVLGYREMGALDKWGEYDSVSVAKNMHAS